MRYGSILSAVLCCALLAAPALAEGKLGLKGIGPSISYVSPEDIDGTVGFGALARLGALTNEIGLEATVDFWSKSDGVGPFEVKFQDISLGARAMYNFPAPESKLKPAVGAGLALHYFRSEIPETTILGLTFGGTETETRIGVDLAGELGYEVGENLDLVGSTTYRIVENFGQIVFGVALVFGIGN